MRFTYGKMFTLNSLEMGHNNTEKREELLTLDYSDNNYSRIRPNFRSRPSFTQGYIGAVPLSSLVRLILSK